MQMNDGILEKVSESNIGFIYMNHSTCVEIQEDLFFIFNGYISCNYTKGLVKTFLLASKVMPNKHFQYFP